MLKRKKLSVGLLLTAMLTMSSVSVYAEEGTNQNKQNPYIEQYLLEQKSKFIKAPDNPVADPKAEEQVIKEVLTNYYEGDLKVADLINKLTGDNSLKKQVTSLVKEDKITVMHKIKDIYSLATDENEKELFYGYLDRYAQDSGDEIAINFLEEITPKQTVLSNLNGTLASYNGSAAGDWAYDNYNKYRRDFPRFTGQFGTDCTNFVSQAMHLAGGKPQSGNWYVSQKNSNYWIINSAAELDNSWSLSDPSPWISVEEFRDYWKPNATTHGFSRTRYESEHATIYNRSINKGDVVVLHKGVANWMTTPSHLMIISRYDPNKKDFLLAGHSNERQALPVLEAIASGPYDYIEFLEL
ncbi:amidase domain-containing protein [Bacillus manliponensis]|uniref:amidase domain-containing protein n=1 Tax=Bacillus manliponensis TaxID=574376 RepID=UPI003511A38F